MMLSTLSILSSLKGGLGLFKKNKGLITGCIVVLLLSACVVLYSLYTKEKAARKQLIADVAQNVKAARDTRQESILRITNKYDKQLALKDSLYTNIMEELDIKERQIRELKTISIGKVTEKLVTQYDTLYEFIEINSNIPLTFTAKHDECITVFGEFTPSGLKTSVKRDLTLVDISYYKRRPLFGLQFKLFKKQITAPRIGRKEYYQTLITNCGDTVTKNQKITFEK